MKKIYSPLRYPGGKSKLSGLTAQILADNKLSNGHYVEPYAGGAGLALSLLFNEHVSDIHINDLDISIWSFWHCVLKKNKELNELIQLTPVNMDEWYKQKEIQANPKKYSVLEIGFATFFLNRTNRSGIINAGVIGGRSQNGNYKIDCRYNIEDLVERIQKIRKYKTRIHLSRLDALKFMQKKQKELPKRTLFYIDPPYFNQGSSLYKSFYGPDDHKFVSEIITKFKKPWIITYDNVPQISFLYKNFRQFTFNINYSVNSKRVGTELLITSKGLKVPKKQFLNLALHKFQFAT